jgi:hypothetical protein
MDRSRNCQFIDPMALQYLERFYSKAQQSSKIAVGSAYKGFDDADASWGKGRVIDQRCGQTWLSTFAVVGRFYSASHQLPALIIPTWNDYEEGTEIETGIDNCVEVKASIRDGKTLVWNISGRKNSHRSHFCSAEKLVGVERDREVFTRAALSQAARSCLCRQTPNLAW